MPACEYLVSHGLDGAVSRCRAAEAIFHRGDQVVVRAPHGLELARVLCQATPRHAELMTHAVLGDVVRAAGPEDEARLERIEQARRQLIDDCQQLSSDLNLPMQVVDVEVFLDETRATLHYLCWGEWDGQLLIDALAPRHECVLELHNLAQDDRPADAEDHNAGCGEPGCGKSHDGGGCTDCSSGGCSTCGSVTPSQLTEYFAGLRHKMEERSRLPLL